ncbi:alkaline phosphatase [Microbulbifer pacificus]|uniref:Alkaline phosphatase n=1 Tax=Microbulbifer pacificus TaxID=407164 RepID=A0AAU0MYC8_9GAMM|nr:alkaline phosphatase [Microbulbifer pacificus]WOX05103.1 alkaline phosphatase [Microbulbifer pacificus]
MFRNLKSCNRGSQAVKGLLLLLLAAAPLSGMAEQSTRNVILLIGDGMDDHQITIARNYLQGANGRLTMDNLPVRSAVQVLTIDEQQPERPVYVADSANSATAIATGVTTSRGRIATSAKDDRDLQTIVELAAANQLATGIVTTASVTDATPASFLAHVSNRGCQSPDTMIAQGPYAGFFKSCERDIRANGGPGSIAEQIAGGNVNIVLGGGGQYFAKSNQGDTHPLAEAAANGFQIIDSPSALQRPFNQNKVLGLFAPKDLPVRLHSSNQQPAAFLTVAEGETAEPQPVTCVVNPSSTQAPSLKSMTEAALGHLRARSDKGFFLMVESASIDKESHERRPCGSIGEVQQLEEALQASLEFAAKHPGTLILVTADHGQAAQLVPYPSMFEGFPGAHSIGRLAAIETPEGSLLGVNYATNDALIEEHSGTQVPLLMNQQPGNALNGVITQPQVFQLILRHLLL